MRKTYTADSFKTTEGIDLVTEALMKGGYVGTAEDLRLLIASILADSQIINGVTTVSAIPPTGNIHAIVVETGTFTNWGGLVNPANTLSVLQRVDGAFSISKTGFDLSGYTKNIDILNISPELVVTKTSGYYAGSTTETYIETSSTISRVNLINATQGQKFIIQNISAQTMALANVAKCYDVSGNWLATITPANLVADGAAYVLTIPSNSSIARFGFMFNVNDTAISIKKANKLADVNGKIKSYLIPLLTENEVDLTSFTKKADILAISQELITNKYSGYRSGSVNATTIQADVTLNYTNLITATQGEKFILQNITNSLAFPIIVKCYDASGNWIASVNTTSLVSDGAAKILTIPSSASIATFGLNFSVNDTTISAKRGNLLSDVNEKIKVSLMQETTPTQSTSSANAWFNNYPTVNAKLSSFFQKYLYSTNATANERTRIILWGNSIFARHQHTSLSDVVPANSPPTLITKNFGAWFWQKLKGNKPTYSRYDAAGIFTQVGTWALLEDATWDDNADIYNAVQNSSTNSASVAFTIPIANDYFNFIDRKQSVAPATNIVISVSGGTGLLQVRKEGETTWNEANGYSFSQANPTANINTGIGNTQFQRRIEFKKVGAGIGVARTVTLTNNSASTNFNYWGLELISNGRKYTQLINVARAGHTLDALKSYSQSDVFDRKPDLIILEIPLLNMVNTMLDIESNVNSLIDFVWGDRESNLNAMSLKNKSNNWVDFQVLLVIPHNSQAHFNTNSTPKNSQTGYTFEMIYNGIKGEMIKRGDVPFIDISAAMQATIDADTNYNGTYYTALGSTGITGVGYMNDSIHQNDKGTLVYAKHICPIFYMV